MIEICRKALNPEQVMESIKGGDLGSKKMIGFGGIDEGSVEQLPPDEETPAVLNFANKALGGLVLSGGGYLQEEILFLCHPELFPTILICASMLEREGVVVRGALRFSKHRGFSGSFQFSGSSFQHTFSPENLINVPIGQTTCHYDVICIDAAVSARVGSSNETAIKRDIVKLLVGFSCSYAGEEGRSISTGNWGCGAFGGNKILKASLQLLVSSITGRKLFFHSFGDQQQTVHLAAFQTFVLQQDFTVSQFYHYIINVLIPFITESSGADVTELWKTEGERV